MIQYIQIFVPVGVEAFIRVTSNPKEVVAVEDDAPRAPVGFHTRCDDE